MAVKFLFATVFVSFVAPAVSTFLASNPESKLASEKGQGKLGVGSIMTNLANFGSQGMSDDELDNMETAVESLVTGGDDAATKIAVKQLQMFITNTLIPNRKRSQQADQKVLDAQFQRLRNCHIDQQIKRDAVASQKVAIAEDHKDDYADSMAGYGGCLEGLDTKALLRDAYCHAVDDVAKACHCETKMVERFGERNVDCSKVPQVSASNEKCCNAHFEYEKHGADCSELRMEASYAKKQHKIIMSPLCNQYEACYDKQLELYQNTLHVVKEGEKHRSWATIQRMQCLFEKFKKGKVAQPDNKSCKDQVHVVEHISYPTIPEKEVCQTRVTP